MTNQASSELPDETRTETHPGYGLVVVRRDNVDSLEDSPVKLVFPDPPLGMELEIMKGRRRHRRNAQ